MELRRLIPPDLAQALLIAWFRNLPAGVRAGLVLTLAAFILRAKTLGNPAVGFDEQWYLLVGDRMLHGMTPYVDLFDRKPMGIFLIYAAIRLMGGEGIWQYQLTAIAFVVPTAWLIWREARRLGGADNGDWAGWAAGIGYIIWLNVMEGDAGQTPVFYNLPMAAAGLLTASLLRGGPVANDHARIAWRGGIAMALTGIAIQIKYNAVFEGMLFGLSLLWCAWRGGMRGARLLGLLLAWPMLAILPTAIVSLVFWLRGQWEPYYFANFVSIFGQKLDNGFDLWSGAAILTAIIAPLVAGTLLMARQWHLARQWDDERRFLFGWAIVAVIAVYAFRRFGSPHYGLPTLVPLTILAGVGYAATMRSRRVAIGLWLLAIAVGQYIVWSIDWRKGTRETVETLVSVIGHEPKGCMFIFDGMPILYYYTNSCFVTRYPFPSHLSWIKEADPKALGVDPNAEVTRIMAAHPAVVIDDWPVYHQVNPTTRRIVEAALARDYQLARIVTHGGDRKRLVYRLKPGLTPHP